MPLPVGFKGIKDQFAPVLGNHEVECVESGLQPASEQAVEKWQKKYPAEAAELGGVHPGVIKLTLRIVDVFNDEGEAKRLAWRYPTLTMGGRSMLMKDLIAFGYTPEQLEADDTFNFEPEDLVGKHCIAVLVEDKQDPTRHSVKALLPLGEGGGSNLP